MNARRIAKKQNLGKGRFLEAFHVVQRVRKLSSVYALSRRIEDERASCLYMFLSQLFSDPFLAVVTLVAFLIALSVHEASHALAAYLLGDKTAQREQRLTLNPLAHIDWTGFVMLVMLGFGWGKPVPFNPYNLRYQRFGPMLVAAAGPLSNVLLAVVAVLGLSVAAPVLGFDNGLVLFLTFLAIMSLVLGVFNLLPIPPLDGSKALLAALAAPQYAKLRRLIEERGPYLLLVLVAMSIFLNINVFGWVRDVAFFLFTFLAALFGVAV